MASPAPVVVVGAVANCTAEVTEDSMDEFEQFWAAYPRKTGKGVARKAFVKAMRLTTLDTMLTALQWQRQQEQWVKQGGQFIPHPSTWLNQERWDDQPTQVPTLSEKTTRTFLAIYGGNDVQ